MSPLKKLSDFKNLNICDSCVFFEISPKIAILLRFIFDEYSKLFTRGALSLPIDRQNFRQNFNLVGIQRFNDDSGTSLPALLSTFNLKQYNLPVTPKIFMKIIADLRFL